MHVRLCCSASQRSGRACLILSRLERRAGLMKPGGTMKKMAFAVLLLMFAGAGVCAWAAPSKVDHISVLLVDGQSGGPYHVWQLTSAAMKKELEDAGLFSVTVATSPRFGEDFGNFKPDFGSYQAVVLNYDAPDWPADLRAQLEHFVNNGGGLVVVHGTDNAFPDWHEFNRMIGVGGWRGRSEKS